MKEHVEYIVEGKLKDSNDWRLIDEAFDSFDDAIDIINKEKTIDGLYNSKKWEYRIKFRVVSEWEILE